MREDREAIIDERREEHEHQDVVDGGGVPVQIRVYKRRFYILFVFCVLACLQCAVWNTWSPMALTVEAAFGWSNGTVALMANWGAITYLIFAAPMCWLMERNLRVSMLVATGFMVFGTSIRCLPVFFNVSDSWFLVTAHVCAILNGISGIIIMSAPPAISAAWFPVNERTTATAFGMLSNALGLSVSFFLVVEVVPDAPKQNGTSNVTSLEDLGYLSDHNTQLMREEIFRLMWVMALPVLLFGIMVLVYFPSHPPLPPSRSSMGVRLNFFKGIRKVIANRDAWLIALTLSIPNGIFGKA